jgi:hypothetical protein
VRRAVLVALLLAAAVVAACGGQLSSSGDDDRVRIAYVPKSLNQEYWVNTKKGAEAGVRGQDAEVITQSANADTEIAEQIDIVENLLAQDVDALAIAPSSSDLLKPVLERAAKDIPVVLVDSDIADWKPKTAYVGTENFDGAKLAGKYIAEQMKDGGTLAVIAGIPGSEIGIERVDGVKAGLKEARSKVKVVKEVPGNFDREHGGGRDGGHPADEPRRRRRVRRQRPDGARGDRVDRGAQEGGPDPARRLRRGARGDAADHRRLDGRDRRPGPLRHGQDRRRHRAEEAARRARAAQGEHRRAADHAG